MANNKKNNTFGATLRARVQNSKAQTESKQAPKAKRTKKSKKTANSKASNHPVDDMSDREFDLLLQEAQQNNPSVQQNAQSTSDIATTESSPTISPAPSVVHDEQDISSPHWTVWLPEIKRLEDQHEAIRYIEIEKEVLRRKRAMMVQSIMDIQTRIAACESTTSESDVDLYDAPLEETMASQQGSRVAADAFDNNNSQNDIAMNGNTGTHAEVSPASPKSRPSTPEPKSSFWVPGIENVQLFNFDFDQLVSSPSSNRSLSPPCSLSPPTYQGIQTHPCPPMSAHFKFKFPSAKEKMVEPIPASVGRRIATPKSKKSASKRKLDAGSDEVIDDELSRSTSSSSLISGDDQALGEVIIGEVEESHLVDAFNKMIGITKTRDLNLKREMRLKVEALVNELVEMERNANAPEV